MQPTTRLFFLLLSSLGFLAISAPAAPIQLQVTTATVSLGECFSYYVQGTVEGTSFAFNSNLFGYCGGSGPYAIAGDTIPSYVNITAPDYPSPILGQGSTYVNLPIPENPGRSAYVIGRLVAYGAPITIPSSGPPVGSQILLQGTLSVCLLPAGASGGPCDPNYLNFGTVNFNVLGTNFINGAYSNPYGFYYTQDYIGTAAAAAAIPEPASFALVGLAALVTAFGYFRPRHRRTASISKNALERL